MEEDRASAPRRREIRNFIFLVGNYLNFVDLSLNLFGCLEGIRK
jgi:hypothetical protein